MAAPGAVTTICPRCQIPAYHFAVDGAGAFSCSRCEWLMSFTANSPLGQTSGTLNAAGTAITLTSPGTPGVPASTTPQNNANTYDVVVNVSGGTVQGVAVGGVPTGRTSGNFTVVAGSSITLTYTVAPAWTWNAPGTLLSNGQQIMVDVAGNLDVVTINGNPTATNIPVTGLGKGHAGGVAIGLLTVAPKFSTVQRVPAKAGWGF